MSDDIVITGMGVLSPIGSDEHSFWNSLRSGHCGAGPVTGLDTSELSRKIACQIHTPLVNPPKCGRAAQLAVLAARQAVRDSGLDSGVLAQARIHTVVGTTMGETRAIEGRLTRPAAEWLNAEHVAEINAESPGGLARSVQTDLQCHGSALDLYGACAAGNMAITSAVRRLRSGWCDIALCGGADGFSILAFLGFMRLRVMASESCRPFDEQRDGLWVGEGAAMFALERESHARARGARIRARIAGCATTCETYHPTRPDPAGEGLSRATQSALRDAGLQPSDVDYICAHGTGTPQNDAIEVTMMDQLFPRGVPFSSIKSLTGHTMGAAAAIEAACCVLSLQHQTMIPTWGLRQVLTPCSAHALTGTIQAAKLRHVVNNSAGFGGYNSSIVLTAA